jgi:NADPH:quinone reductase-like Zn-dependent oxidoreductase
MVYTRYGGPDDLHLQAVPTPSPNANEVLVHIHASSINAWDWDLLRGRPYLTRLSGGFRGPKHRIIGADVAGRIEAVGEGVTRFQPGDTVFGDVSGSGWGGFAQYVSVQESVLATMPDGLTFEQAAAIPQAGVLALQALRKLEPLDGQRLLIIGAGGGVGTFAVQLARNQGAIVTVVDRADKLDMLRSLGASRTLDFQTEDFADAAQSQDAIVDMVMQRSLLDYQRVLAPGGRLVVVGGQTGRIFQMLALGPVLSRASGKRLGLLIHRPNRTDLETLGELVATGQVVPVIDRTYPLARLPEAFRSFGAGNVRGKVVISVDGQSVPESG